MSSHHEFLAPVVLSIFILSIAPDCTIITGPELDHMKIPTPQGTSDIAVKTDEAIPLRSNAYITTDQSSHYQWSANKGQIRGSGQNIEYLAPATMCNDRIEVKITENDSILYSETIRVLVYKQLIILKADDLVFDEYDIISDRWSTFLEYIRTKNIKASLGLICNSLEQGKEPYISRLKQYLAFGNFEIWNHGYSHFMNGKNEKGEWAHEFMNTPFQYQLEHLQKSQRLVKQKLGITMRTFGAPGNACDENTVKALEQLKDIKIWYFGRSASDKLQLERSTEVEHITGVPNFDTFVQRYNPHSTYLVLQVHPNLWSHSNFSEFQKIVDYLIESGVSFVTPYEYYRFTSTAK